MNDDLGGTTLQLVSLALDAASMRHMAIANNIANANSQNYTPLHVSFEDQLTAVEQDLLTGTDDGTLSARLADIRPSIEADDAIAGVDGNPGVKLDMEMARLARNVVQYQALLKGLSSEMAIIKLAVNEGRK